MSDREVWHGTHGGYTNHACRCSDCRAAAMAVMKRSKAERLALRQMVDGKLIHPDAPHGTCSAYSNYGCRCDECRTANTRYSQQVRSRKAVA